MRACWLSGSKFKADVRGGKPGRVRMRFDSSFLTSAREDCTMLHPATPAAHPPDWDSSSQRAPALTTLRRGTRAMCQDSSEAQLEWLPEVVTQVLAAGGGSIPELCHLDGRRVPGTGPKPGVSSISPPDFPMVRLSNWKGATTTPCPLLRQSS
jgi:hypothetical protein